MDKKQRKRLIGAHRDSFARHGHSPRALFWESRGVQWVRFKALAEIGVEPGDSLLDVGCGFGDLRSWLLGQDIEVEYTGLDLSPDLIEKAKAIHAKGEFIAGDIFDLDAKPQSFDWVLLSGALNWQLDDGGDYARRVIARMYKLCRKGVAFNMLNTNYWKGRSLHELVAFDPDEMLAFCKEISPNCTLRNDYLDNDFTIYLHRALACSGSS